MGGCSKEHPQAAERSRVGHDSSKNYADRVGWVSAGTETGAGWRCPEERGGDSGHLGARDGRAAAAVQDGGCLCELHGGERQATVQHCS